MLFPDAYQDEPQWQQVVKTIFYICTMNDKHFVVHLYSVHFFGISKQKEKQAWPKSQSKQQCDKQHIGCHLLFPLHFGLF